MDHLIKSGIREVVLERYLTHFVLRADSCRGDTIGGQILNMLNTESRPALQRIGRRLWRIGRQLYYTHTHTLIVEESVLESADYSSKSANSNAILPKSVCGYGPLVVF